MEVVKIKIFVNQLGNLKIQWKIPSNLFSNNEEIQIQLPSFKFDLPKIASLPVPFSSKALKIEIKNIQLESFENSLSYNLNEDFEGNIILKLITSDFKIEQETDTVNLSYELENIVNSDTIYYIFVYPLINPFSSEIKFSVEVKARFSYKIRKYKFREWYFDRLTGKRLKINKVFNTKKSGDLITVNTNNAVLDQNVELDIHLTGSRFPFMIRRDVFWLIVFLISLGLILSPIWSAFI